MRRSAVRTFERAGVPRSVAMSIVGHKTESIYRRYAIVDEAMQREAAARLDAYAARPRRQRKTGTVSTFRPKTQGNGVREHRVCNPRTERFKRLEQNPLNDVVGVSGDRFRSMQHR